MKHANILSELQQLETEKGENKKRSQGSQISIGRKQAEKVIQLQTCPLSYYKEWLTDWMNEWIEKKECISQILEHRVKGRRKCEWENPSEQT